MKKMELLKEWPEFEKMKNQAISVIQKWYVSNLVIKNGSDFIDGLAYTSSSSFAALWDCNCNTVYKWDPHFHFLGVAISIDGFIVAVFNEFDDNGNELFNDDIKIIIGRLKWNILT